MSEQPSAIVIAFPRMKAAPAPREDIAEPGIRLQRALASLERALSDQRAAVQAWQQSLGALRGSVQGLGSSLETYRDGLGTLAGSMDGLTLEAQRLEAWADGVLSREAAASPQA